MLVERWDPFREIRRPLRESRNVEGAVDRIRGSVGYRTVSPRGERARAESWRIPLDVVRVGDDVVVEASLPGVKPADISVTIDDNVLRISGHTGADEERSDATYVLSERRTGSFHRSVVLPDSVDAEHAYTSHEAGVLTVTLPKLEAKKAKQLTIEVKDSKELAAT